MGFSDSSFVLGLEASEYVQTHIDGFARTAGFGGFA